MSTFLTGDALNDAIDDIIQNAKRFLHITSPYIKLDDHFKERFDLIKNNPNIHLLILFGKNEKDFNRSVKSKDLEYFKEFPNISILFEPKLHAKSYVNESQGIITSMNLYDYSAENNVEYGISFNKSTLTETIYKDHAIQHDNLLEDSAHCVFIKRPVFKMRNLGFTKNYLRSEILLDKSERFRPNSRKYERVAFFDIDIESLTDKDRIPELKSRSAKRIEQEEKLKEEERIKALKEQERLEKQRQREERRSKSYQEDDSNTGYCIRTGERIPFNPEQPLSRDAYYEWLEWKNMDYKENYCHKTGQLVKYKVSMRHPILNSNYENKDVWNAPQKPAW